MILSSGGCKVSWALRGGTGNAASAEASAVACKRYPLRNSTARTTVISQPGRAITTVRCLRKNRCVFSDSPRCTLRISSWGRGMRRERDGCDDCDGISDTDPGAVLIVTTVTNRHTDLLVRLMALPVRVRFTVYSMLYSFSKSPALTLSLRVRIFG